MYILFYQGNKAPNFLIPFLKQPKLSTQKLGGYSDKHY
jgi:hypothetical protein